MSASWLTQSFTAMALLIPAWLAIGFFDRNYQIKPDIFIIWYFLGVGLNSLLFGQSPMSAVFPSWKLILIILIIGFTVGGVANVALFSAVSKAPNPGLPVAIANVASVGVFFVAALLYRYLPNYFNSVKIDIWALVGLLLTVVGTAIISIRK